ncbi:hypothetical protein AALP_AA2G253300 [Arabis alpina]|uniref:Uncharacterized protein n=1 Tax=Arabis alpina TaxID=50452 RepID=A0A087HJW4_ARAAL|nr:hypothetical protein AALP_AA2G253300 [Arabis alpina]
MLLRSLSAPILKYWLPQHCSSLEQDSQLQRRNRSLSLLSSKSFDEHTGEVLHQALSAHKESVLKSSNNDAKTLIPSRQHRSSLDDTATSVLKSSNNDDKTLIPCKQRRSSLDETSIMRKSLNHSPTFLVERLFSSSGMGEKVKGDDVDRLETLVSGGGGGGSSGGKICTGGGGVGGSGVDGGGSVDATDAYYREMIELNPGNSLLTGNYAKFLKEVKGDVKKAEEYCERAILGNTNDGNVLSLYADLILQNHGDHKRADSYFQQAVKMSPEDCYVQASYARFLWDVEEEEEEEEEDKKEQQKSDEMADTSLFRDFPKHIPVTTSS